MDKRSSSNGQSIFHTQYCIIKMIGEGAHAQVFKCTNKLSHEDFAVKMFKNISNLQNNQMIAIRKEISILRLLAHPYIIKIHDVLEENDHIYIIMDFLKGQDLAQAFTKHKNKFNISVIQNLMWKLLIAVNFVHQNNIIHRDLKPQNIILKHSVDYSDIIVIDFGLADYYNSQGSYLFPKCGTLGYIAPEVFDNDLYDFKVDSFSIGAILYTLLTGVNPFCADLSSSIFDQNSKCEIDFNLLLEKSINQKCVDLCQQLLQKNPNMRISVDEALNHKWFKTPIVPCPQLMSLKRIAIPGSTKKQIEDFVESSPLWCRSQSSESSSINNSKLNNENVQEMSIDEIDELTEVRVYEKQWNQKLINEEYPKADDVSIQHNPCQIKEYHIQIHHYDNNTK